jgi:hypothetical protein
MVVLTDSIRDFTQIIPGALCTGQGDLLLHLFQLTNLLPYRIPRCINFAVDTAQYDIQINNNKKQDIANLYGNLLL